MYEEINGDSNDPHLFEVPYRNIVMLMPVSFIITSFNKGIKFNNPAGN